MDPKIFQFVICRNAFVNRLYLAKIRTVLNPDYLYSPSCRIWIKVIIEFYDEHLSLPNFTEMQLRAGADADKLEKVRQVIEDRFCEDYNFEELIANTEKFCQEQAVLAAVTKIAEDRAREGDVEHLTPTEILELVKTACNTHIDEDIGFDYINMIDDFCERITKPFNTISTGFRWLDKMLGGGWDRDGWALYVFAGQTNVGKSIFLGQFAARGFQNGETVVLISLEMSAVMYCRRLTANLMQIGMNEQPQRVDDIKNKASELKSNGKGRLIVKEFPTRGITCANIANYLEDLIRNGIQPTMVVIDYLNLINSGKKNVNSYEDGKTCSEQLRALSCYFKVPFITATQLNREGFGRESPSLETTSESIGTSFTCDAQIALWQTDEQKQMGMVGMGMQKSRFGRNNGSTILTIDYPHMTILEPEDNVEELEGSNPAVSVVNEAIESTEGFDF